MNTTQILKDLCEKVGITSEFGARLDWDKQDDWQRNANGYHVTLKYQGRQMSIDYWMGVGLTGEPTAEGVLECLLSDSVACDQSFEEWCENFSYDTDSRRAEAVYNACVKSGKKLKRLLGEDYETFLNAERI